MASSGVGVFGPLVNQPAPKTYIISMGNELDNARLAQNNLEPGTYTIVEGVKPSEVPDAVKEKFAKGRASEARQLGLMAAMSAHIKVWEQIIADGNPPAIILASDAKKVRSLPSELPSDGIAILGGNLRIRKTSDVSTDQGGL